MRPINDTHISSGRARASIGWSLAAALELPYRWLERAEERRRLRTLDPRLRQDIGVSAADVEREARKAFWQA